MVKQTKVDALIFGGGISSLWTNSYLASRGYTTLVVALEEGLGGEQTGASQGIIHGGIKYALRTGAKRESALEVSKMPTRWRQHLSGEREDPNLSEVDVRSQDCYMWISNSISGGKLGELFNRAALNAVRTRRERATSGVPTWLEESARAIYVIGEQVVNTQSLIKVLASPYIDRIIYSDQERMLVQPGQNDVGHRVILDDKVIESTSIILAAGEGNETLARAFGISEKIMQRRPLRQAIARGHNLPEFYGHCVDGCQPYATITTHGQDETGRTIWTIGGKVAEDGPKMTGDELAEHAKIEVSKCLSGLDLSGTEWDSFYINRAEGASGGERPAGVHIYQRGDVICVWPTKLALAPTLAEQIEARLPEPDKSLKDQPVIGSGEIRMAKPLWAH